MSNFLDQFNDNVRTHNRRLPQRLLKVAIVMGMVIVIAPLTSVVGRALGPAAAMVVAIAGFFATLALWWLASLIMFPNSGPAIAPVPPAWPGQPVAPPMAARANPPRRGGAGLALVAAGGLLLFSCCGGGTLLLAALGSLAMHRQGPVAPEADDDPLAGLDAQHRQLEDSLRQQEKHFRDLERQMQRDPFGK